MGTLPNRKKRREFEKKKNKKNSKKNSFKSLSERFEDSQKKQALGRMLHNQHLQEVEQSLVDQEATKNHEIKMSLLNFYGDSEKASEEFRRNQVLKLTKKDKDE